MSHVTKLSVHRNTRERRRRHEARDALRSRVRDITRNTEMAGFALLVWEKDRSARTFWDVGDLFPGRLLPEMARSALQADITKLDVSDMLDGPPPEDEGA